MSIREAATFGSEAFAGRGADFAVWVEGHEIPPAQVIGEDQDDIGARREALRDDRKRNEEERKQDESANFAVHRSFSVETVQEMKEREVSNPVLRTHDVPPRGSMADPLVRSAVGTRCEMNRRGSELRFITGRRRFHRWSGSAVAGVGRLGNLEVGFGPFPAERA